MTTNQTAKLPASADGCMGFPVDGPGQLIGFVNVLCRGCLRYQSRKSAIWIMPTPQIAHGNGTYYCAKRIGE